MKIDNRNNISKNKMLFYKEQITFFIILKTKTQIEDLIILNQ